MDFSLQIKTKKPDTFVSGFVLLPLLEKVAVLTQWLSIQLS
jgi:hypothetical protein